MNVLLDDEEMAFEFIHNIFFSYNSLTFYMFFSRMKYKKKYCKYFDSLKIAPYGNFIQFLYFNHIKKCNTFLDYNIFIYNIYP